MSATSRTPRVSLFRAFVDSNVSGGIILMIAALLALIVANSPWAEIYSIPCTFILEDLASSIGSMTP